ncbi:MAG: biopolymer transporter ExbD [Phycisphaerales bacterium]
MPRARERASQPRRRSPGHSPATLALNLTPMIDVTFQLLVYFLLATSFVLGEEIYRVDLPDRSEQRVRNVRMASDAIVIHVRSTGSGVDDYALDVEGPLPNVTTAAQLAEALAGSVVSVANPRGTTTRSSPIVIAPTADARWEHAVTAFDAAVKAGFRHVAFAPGAREAKP